MKSKLNFKSIAILIIFVLFTQIIMPFSKVYAANLVNITFEDQNLYNLIVEELVNKIYSKDNNTLTITMTETNVNSVKKFYFNEKGITKITGIDKFINLEELALRGNNIADITAIQNLTGLTVLNLGNNNNILDVTPIQNLTNLKTLDLHQTNIVDITPILNLTNLTILSIWGNNIDNIDGLQNLTKLTTLSLRKNNIKDITPIKNLTNLTELRLSENKIEDASILDNELKNANCTAEDDIILASQKISIDSDNAQVELPKIFLQAKDQNSRMYTEANFELTNCTLSEDGKSINVTDMTKTASVKIIGGMAGNTILTINEIVPLQAKVEYSTTNPTNQNVTATITTVIEGKELKPLEGWTLSEDKKSLSKEYPENKEETVTLTDTEGKTTKIPVKVSNIDKIVPTAEVTYTPVGKTKEDVLVTITASEKIKEIEDWNRSEDQMTLTRIYKSNNTENLTIYDLAENSADVDINVTNIDKEKPIVTDVKYTTTMMTNEDVTVTITANEEIQPLEGWTLSEDMKTLTKTYTENKSEEIEVYDLAGNKGESTIISINNIDKVNPNVTVEYSTTENTTESVTVTINVDEKIKSVEGWILSEDQTTLTKVFTINDSEEVLIHDLADNIVKVNVSVTNIKKVVEQDENQDGSNVVNSIDNVGTKDDVNNGNNVKRILPKTGAISFNIVLIVAIAFAIYTNKKNRYLKGIK